MRGSVVQVNVSKGGVPKLPVLFGVATANGLTADRHAHPHIHGGPRKALLLATSEGIEELQRAGFAVFPGALGENLTTEGLDRRRIRCGQRYRVGDVIVEVTEVREPCDTLNPCGAGIQKAVYDAAVAAGDPASPRWGLSGFYLAVVQAGTIRAGNSIELLDEAA